MEFNDDCMYMTSMYSHPVYLVVTVCAAVSTPRIGSSPSYGGRRKWMSSERRLVWGVGVCIVGGKCIVRVSAAVEGGGRCERTYLPPLADASAATKTTSSRHCYDHHSFCYRRHQAVHEPRQAKQKHQQQHPC